MSSVLLFSPTRYSAARVRVASNLGNYSPNILQGKQIEKAAVEGWNMWILERMWNFSVFSIVLSKGAFNCRYFLGILKSGEHHVCEDWYTQTKQFDLNPEKQIFLLLELALLTIPFIFQFVWLFNWWEGLIL